MTIARTGQTPVIEPPLVEAARNLDPGFRTGAR